MRLSRSNPWHFLKILLHSEMPLPRLVLSILLLPFLAAFSAVAQKRMD